MCCLLLDRTSWLYGIHGPNFVKTILRLAAERETLGVVSDQFGSPTNAADLAEAVLCIAEKIKNDQTIKWGTYHYCGRGVTTWHRFAEQIVSFAKVYQPLKVKTIRAISTAEYQTPAKRPAYSALDCGKIEANFSIRTKPWCDSLEAVVKSICEKKIQARKFGITW